MHGYRQYGYIDILDFNFLVFYGLYISRANRSTFCSGPEDS